jgi:hypothetical protein
MKFVKTYEEFKFEKESNIVDSEVNKKILAEKPINSLLGRKQELNVNKQKVVYINNWKVY